MDKSKMRPRLASLSFTEKIKILEKLRDREKAITAAGLRKKPSQTGDQSIKKDQAIFKLENYWSFPCPSVGTNLQ
jgi:hypothetical protein